MPRELVTIQVGQAGNQIGCRFWELALREHAAHNPKGVFDESLSSFFRNVDTKYQPFRNLSVGDGTSSIRSLKARSVIVDMECGVINEMLKGPLGDVLDNNAFISDVSGAGNNWAHGNHYYGPKYRDQILEKVRTAVEACESLQSFLLLHSIGGGTGSGVGTYILEQLADEYPNTFRFTTSVFPSEDDDVVTSPYNALLSLSKLVEFADCVLPIENQALLEVAMRIDGGRGGGGGGGGASVPAPGVVQEPGKSKPYDAMNGIAANMLLNMTSSVRFEGSLNVDLNDITMNLVPFPHMHFLISSMSPFSAPKDIAKLTAPRTLDQIFSEVFSREHQLIRADPRHSTYLACGLLMRGSATISDINRNIQRIRPSLRMAHWNQEGFKIGICSKPPVGVPNALLCLANNCAITTTFGSMRDRFAKLFKRKVYTHHYETYMDLSCFTAAAETVTDIIEAYTSIDTAPPPPVVRLRPKGLTFL